MLFKAILFLLLIYLIVGVFRHIFEFNRIGPSHKKTQDQSQKQQKNIANIFDAEDIPFEEIENKPNER